MNIRIINKIKFAMSASFEDLYKYIKESQKTILMAFADLNMLSYIILDKNFRNLMRDFDIVLPDGISVKFWLKTKVSENINVKRLPGPDFFQMFLQIDKNFSHAFIGSSNETLRKIIERVRMENPDLRIAGIFSPPYEEEISEDTSKTILKFLEEKHPDIAWISFGCPKQEKWVWAHKEILTSIVSKAVIPIGAAFDFYAGTVKRAPLWMRKAGLESLFRFFLQPRKVFSRWVKGTIALLSDMISRE